MAPHPMCTPHNQQYLRTGADHSTPEQNLGSMLHNKQLCCRLQT
eukprot:CAMPEP_0203880192 /NCGR_PEP_ID=MMETSP0359-20131031/24596_1 /ASSEMBLY_ACC=CAM_ASM_000338 /TAXON_ID=268821 /ORGANISM="Scrippsiella Hangoei, Strain SHTV-5" /LENGTH=43 /DNA_ID= /DNA_START= /DNA_END= /DNA_ORIENTATION=